VFQVQQQLASVQQQRLSTHHSGSSDLLVEMQQQLRPQAFLRAFSTTLLVLHLHQQLQI